MGKYKAGLILKKWREQTLNMRRPEFTKTFNLAAKGWDEYYLTNHEEGKALLNIALLNYIRDKANMPDEVYQQIIAERKEDLKRQFAKTGDQPKAKVEDKPAIEDKPEPTVTGTVVVEGEVKEEPKEIEEELNPDITKDLPTSTAEDQSERQDKAMREALEMFEPPRSHSNNKLLYATGFIVLIGFIILLLTSTIKPPPQPAPQPVATPSEVPLVVATADDSTKQCVDTRRRNNLPTVYRFKDQIFIDELGLMWLCAFPGSSHEWIYLSATDEEKFYRRELTVTPPP